MKVVKNEVVDTVFVVEKYSPIGQYLGVVAGMGAESGNMGFRSKES